MFSLLSLFCFVGAAVFADTKAPSDNAVVWDKLSVTVSPDGVFTGVIAGEPPKTFQFFVNLPDWTPQGDTNAQKEADKLLQRRAYLSKDGRYECEAQTSVFPAAGSIRWEVALLGACRATGMGPVEIHLRWPDPEKSVWWTAWSDPLQSNEGWHDPLVFQPFQDRLLYYGAPPFEESNPRAGYCPVEGNTFCIPMVTIAEPQQDRALSLIQQPEPELLDIEHPHHGPGRNRVHPSQP